MGYSPWGRKESDMTEQLTVSPFFFFCLNSFTFLLNVLGDVAADSLSSLQLITSGIILTDYFNIFVSRTSTHEH